MTEEKLLCGITPAFPPKGTTSGQVLLTRRNFHKRKSRLGFTDCPSSSEKSHVVAPVKITIAFARLFLLRSTTNFFRLSVFRFAQNATLKILVRRKRGASSLFFMSFISYAPDGACRNGRTSYTLSLKRKCFYTALRLLFRKKPRQRSHVKNYRFTRFFTARLTTAFFRLSVPLFGRNANARSFCLRKT